MDTQNGTQAPVLKEYVHECVLFYEKICGPCFLSPGGKEIAKELVSIADLKPGEKVLDIGGGIGGSAFYMAQNFNVHVTSVDISAYNTNIGQERGKQLGCGSDQVVFETADITVKEYPTQSFDVVFAITCFFYIEDKLSLLNKLYTFLKPGGRLVFADLCCLPGHQSEGVQNFAQKWNNYIISVEAYEQMLNSQTKFENIHTKDKSDQIREVLRSCTARLETEKDELIEEFGLHLHNQVTDLMREDSDLFEKGEFRAGLFYADRLL